MTERGRLVGRKVTANMLAKVLSEQIRRPIEDLTGITEPFDFVLEWTPDADFPIPAAGPPPTLENSSRLSLVTAITEQLGFRLNSRKSAVQVIVIDYIERTPTEN